MRGRAQQGRLLMLAALIWAAAGVGVSAADGSDTRFFAEANRLRAAHGAPPLTIDARLACAARLHAADMAATGRLSHQGSDGTTLTTRLARVNYRFTRAAENVAQAGRDSRKVLALWMASPGHKRNLLDPHLTEAGLGRAHRLATGETFWGLVLGSRFSAAPSTPGVNSSCP
jgi:uncharacterized protein YkwD